MGLFVSAIWRKSTLILGIYVYHVVSITLRLSAVTSVIQWPFTTYVICPISLFGTRLCSPISMKWRPAITRSLEMVYSRQGMWKNAGFDWSFAMKMVAVRCCLSTACRQVMYSYGLGIVMIESYSGGFRK